MRNEPSSVSGPSVTSAALDSPEPVPMPSAALPGLDLRSLEAYLTREHPGLTAGPISGRLLAGGKSNLTYAVTDDHHRWVLRRPPLGHVLATAHDMNREFRVISALAGSAVPVPGAVLLCQDDSVIGAPFYLMEEAGGRVFRNAAELASLPPDTVRELLFRVVDTLAALHAVSPEHVGLLDFGRPDGFNERQVRRWQRQLESAPDRGITELAELADQIGRDVPAVVEAAIVHGDFRLDNLLVELGDGPPAISAVLDWEMSTLGDPLSDVALMLLYASQPIPGTEGLAAAGGAPISVAGHPLPAELVRRYTETSGRQVDNLWWYSAFACFKLAAIMEGVHARYEQGAYGDQPGFGGIGAAVGPLAAAGLSILKER